MRNARRVVASMVALTLLLLIPTQAAMAGNADRAQKAVGYLVANQESDGSIVAFSAIGSTSDAVLAMVATKRAPKSIRRAMNFLKARVVAGDTIGSVGLTAKVLLAVVASGRNPTAFGGRNLIADIASTEVESVDANDGRYGANTAVFDHALAILALAGTDVDPTADASDWLADAQCLDGGWAYDNPPGANDDSHCYDTTATEEVPDWFTSDTNTTSLAVQGLAAVNGPDPANNPFDYFLEAQDGVRGGWGYGNGYPTDSNSTAMVIQAFVAGEQPLPIGSMAALQALQHRGKCGAFAYSWTGPDVDDTITGPDIGSTIGAIPGLLKKPLPIMPTPVTKTAPLSKGCPT